LVNESANQVLASCVSAVAVEAYSVVLPMPSTKVPTRGVVPEMFSSSSGSRQ
jgi:hypothetical protein